MQVQTVIINEEDPLFGVMPLSFKTFNHFRADIQADDLDSVITAPREGVEESPIKEKFKQVITELFSEARQQYEKFERDEASKDKRKNENERNYVSPRLVEHPVADVLYTNIGEGRGPEADEDWFYLDVGRDVDVKDLTRKLYDTSKPRSRYKYVYTGLGASERLVKFDPATSTFLINENHALKPIPKLLGGRG